MTLTREHRMTQLASSESSSPPIDDVFCAIITWPGYYGEAEALEAQLAQWLEVFVISRSKKGTCPRWHEDYDAWFTKQMAIIRQKFLESGKPYLYIILADTHMKDGRYRDFIQDALLLDRTLGQCGVIYPQQDFSAWQFSPEDAKTKYFDDVYECPLIDFDLLQCLISRQVMLKCPQWDFDINQLGWGVAISIAQVARKMGWRVVQDRRYQTIHPEGTGYSRARAKKELRAFGNLYRIPVDRFWIDDRDHKGVRDAHYHQGRRLWAKRKYRSAIRVWIAGTRNGSLYWRWRCLRKLRKKGIPGQRWTIG